LVALGLAGFAGWTARRNVGLSAAGLLDSEFAGSKDMAEPDERDDEGETIDKKDE
jgi:hypothetical protein